MNITRTNVVSKDSSQRRQFPKTKNIDGIKTSGHRRKRRHHVKTSIKIEKNERVNVSREAYGEKNTPEQNLRIIPLGGQEEVGRNMTVLEYGDDIVIVDMGVQFPEEDMPGIDYIIPNASYLKGKEKRIRGVIFTHGHLDHIGAAPILLKQLGYPPIIGRDLTLALIKRKVEESEKGSINKLKTIAIKTGNEKVRLGGFQAKFFDVEHSIMDSIGVALFTPVGTVIHMGDWTLDVGSSTRGAISYEFLSTVPKPSILMMESLGSVNRKSLVTEEDMWGNLRKVIDEAPGRIIFGTFSSQVKRIRDVVEYAQKVGRKVAIDGYSMKTNFEVAKELGYIKVPKDAIIDIKEIHKYPKEKVIVICTGAQGEARAVLSRIVTGDHRFIKLQKDDTVLFSSSVVPGNERTVQRLKDNLYRKCDSVIHSDIMDIHVGGHNNIEAIQELVKQVKPTYTLPVYANHFFLKEAKKVIERRGFPGKNVFILDNGQVINFSKNKRPFIEKKKVDTSYVFVDGLGVGDIGQVVLRDRQMLAEDGMFMITVIIDSRSKKIIGNIQITSRGFIFVKENFDLVNDTKKVIEKVVKKATSPDTSLNWDSVKKQMREAVGSFLYKKTQRRPMVLPVVIEV